jgi:hypothetical protein
MKVYEFMETIMSKGVGELTFAYMSPVYLHRYDEDLEVAVVVA